MIEADLAYAFTVGMVAAVNPCGFALLPAYLSYFLGLEGAEHGTTATAQRALAVSLTVTGGFMLVFGIMGLLITQLSVSIERHLPWATMAIGAGVIVLGFALLRGFEPTLRLPKVRVGTIGGDLPGMFVFGVSYAVASISCTIGVFLVPMTRTFGSANLASGVAVFLMYALGMGVLLGAITIALAGARGALVARLRRIQPYINRVSGALLVVAGSYLVYYGWWERGVYADAQNAPPSGPVDVVTDVSAQIATWINNFGGVRLGIVLGALMAITLLLGLNRRHQAPDPV